MATVRKTPQRTVGVDDDLWADAHAIARVRRQRVSDVLRSALVSYCDENRAVLDEIKRDRSTEHLD